MNITNYVVCKDILGIQTNSKYIGWSFGHPTEAATAEAFERCKVKVRLNLDSQRDVFRNLSDQEKYHYWQGRPDQDALYYERRFFAGSKLRLNISGIKGQMPELTSNRNFLKYIKFRFNNLHSPGYHLTDLVCALLLQKGYSPLHCSGFRHEKATVAVIAPPDTGKTLTTMRAVFDSGADFIAEDLGITDGRLIHACPWTSTFRYYDDLSMSWLLRWRMKVIKVIPPVELIPVPGDSRKIDTYISKDRILDHSPITHVAILARRAGGIEELDKETAYRMVQNLNRYEFVYMKNPMLTAYSYFNPEFNILELEKTERSVLKTMVNNSQCLLVQSEDPTKFSDMIIHEIDKS